MSVSVSDLTTSVPDWTGEWTTRDGRTVVVTGQLGELWEGTLAGVACCSFCGHPEDEHVTEEDSYCTGGCHGSEGPGACRCRLFRGLTLYWRDGGLAIGNVALDLMDRTREGARYR